MKVTEHGKYYKKPEIPLPPCMIEVSCPECGKEQHVDRKTYWEYNYFGRLMRTYSYAVECKECGCEFSDVEKIKRNKVDLKVFLRNIAITLIIIIIGGIILGGATFIIVMTFIESPIAGIAISILIFVFIFVGVVLYHCGDDYL